jgi:hypothetical protein
MDKEFSFCIKTLGIYIPNDIHELLARKSPTNSSMKLIIAIEHCSFSFFTTTYKSSQVYIEKAPCRGPLTIDPTYKSS